MNARSPHPRTGEGSSTPSTHSPQARTALLLDLLELRLDDVLLVLVLRLRLAVTVAGVGAGCYQAFTVATFAVAMAVALTGLAFAVVEVRRGRRP